MGKTRKILIGILTVCMTVCAGMALASCKKDDYPDFKNPASTIIDTGNNNEENKYTIKVRSMGGLALDKVQVNLKKNGQVVVGGLSENGEIVVYADTDDYDVEVVESSLPDGYYLPEQAYKTGGDKEIVIHLPSGIISSTASSSTIYRLGDVMHDFRFTANDGEEYLLSDLAKEYKAVVLNFFFTTCGPCNQEFPAIQEAYEAFNDKIALVALADPSKDSATSVRNYQPRMGLTFLMGMDVGLIENFSVSGFPTTIIIDRYGVIAYRESGYEDSAEVWKQLFARFTSDNYVQEIEAPNEGEDGEVKENIKPTGVSDPDYSLMPSQIATDSANKVVKFETETNEKDAEYNWPWTVESDEEYVYMTASNSGQDPSFSIIYCELDLKFGDMVSFDYSLYSQDGYDMFYVIVDGITPLAQLSGNSGGWKTLKNIYVANANKKVTFSFTYLKAYSSQKTPLDGDFARVKNISVVNVEDTDEAIDVERSVFYENFTIDNVVLNPEDGYYHIANTGNSDYDGALLFIDFINQTPWSYEHTGTYTFTPSGTTSLQYTSMYALSYWEMSNRGGTEENESLKYDYLERADANYFNDLYSLQMFSDNGYIPVTERFKDILVQFLRAFNKTEYCAITCDDNDWIKMCYFFQHYNSENFEHWETVKGDDGEEHLVKRSCFVHDDPIDQMYFFNAHTAVESVGDEFANHVNIKKANATNGGGGVYYKFTASRAGVYRIASASDPEATIDTELNIYKPVGNDYREYMSLSTNFSYDAINKSGIHGVPNGDSELIIEYDDGTQISNFFGYIYLEENETIYLQLFEWARGRTCEYELSIKYVGESYDWLRTCSTVGLNTFIGITDENNDIVDYTYAAINVAHDMDTDCWYHYDKYEYASKIYIDFVNRNYFDGLGHTLAELIDGGTFDLREYGQRNYTDKIKEYYRKSIEGKDESDPEYGMLEANMELSEIISEVLYWRNDGDGFSRNVWLAAACYYQHFGK